jgi:aspartyl-tRNA(Asn)/glutamyl-tRNA(Gln) amidotransferase subunit A
MKYDISVKEFLEQSKQGNIEYADFVHSFMDELNNANRKFRFMRFTNKQVPTEKRPVLFGLPFTIKDNICVKDMVSSAGSKILDGYEPPFDATAVARVRRAGAFIVGKTNQDEFGFGTFSTNSAYGIPKNPNDPERSCGGSSGGAAAVIAALPYPQIALAESTGGSISCPAAFCNVVGLTPTYGLVSRYGLIDYANSLDKIGIISKSVHDAAIGLSMIAGHDDRDSTSLKVSAKDYSRYSTKLKGINIAVPKEYFENIDETVEKAVWDAIKKLESEGATYKEVSLPNTKYALAAYYIVATTEASTNLSKFCGMRYGAHDKLEGNFNEYFTKVRTENFGEEAKRRIILGTFARMSGYREQYYMKAMRVRTLIIQDFKRTFKSFDAIAAPTMPVIAPRFTQIEKLSPLENYQMDVLTVPANLAGVPQISVPCGPFTGLHLIADHMEEEKMLGIAAAFEAVI